MFALTLILVRFLEQLTCTELMSSLATPHNLSTNLFAGLEHRKHEAGV